jgi:predicted nucleic acid-binding protein
MTLAVVLDSGPLGLVTQRRKKSTEADACRLWLDTLLRNGTRVYVPEIVDYELRRELLRSGKAGGIARLDALKMAARYVPISTPAMLRAAELWAEVRKGGLPTAAPDALDVDVILAAQALSLSIPGLVVATSNSRHLGRFVLAMEWRQITLP